MAKSAHARKRAPQGNRVHGAPAPKLRQPELPAVPRRAPRLGERARRILERMKADDRFFPSADETLLILGYAV
ncbi:MAG: hypothetical protein FJZ01_22650 [Candidatus Sericytochromatia bacterium]|nr:hypothetical protein [Candidatus Tanganyikabacteria bacterium]